MAENVYLPELPDSPMFIGDEKVMTIEWQEFFRTMFNRIGGVAGPGSTDTLLSIVSDLYSTPKNYGKRIDELEKQLQTFIKPILTPRVAYEYVQPSFDKFKINWTKITANGVSLLDGPPTSSDTVSDLRVAHDGNIYTVDEDSASAGQNLIVDFTGVSLFNWVQILGYYDGQTSHELQVQLEVSPFDDSTWHDYNCMNPDHDYMSDYSFFVLDSHNYINNGTVKIRFLHNESGNANDDWIIDVVALYK